jgi:hypothetical protein
MTSSPSPDDDSKGHFFNHSSTVSVQNCASLSSPWVRATEWAVLRSSSQLLCSGDVHSAGLPLGFLLTLAVFEAEAIKVQLGESIECRRLASLTGFFTLLPTWIYVQKMSEIVDAPLPFQPSQSNVTFFFNPLIQLYTFFLPTAVSDERVMQLSQDRKTILLVLLLAF